MLVLDNDLTVQEFNYDNYNRNLALINLTDTIVINCYKMKKFLENETSAG